MWSIRTAESADHDAVVALWSAAGLGRTAPDEWEALIAGPTAVVLVADDGGEVIGSAVASFDGWRAYVYHVAVDAGRRREGLGHALMAEAEQYLVGAGARYVYAPVHEENTDGLALVAATGYGPEGDLLFAKRLAARVSDRDGAAATAGH